jgi:hypothetical protein
VYLPSIEFWERFLKAVLQNVGGWTVWEIRQRVQQLLGVHSFALPILDRDDNGSSDRAYRIPILGQVQNNLWNGMGK